MVNVAHNHPEPEHNHSTMGMGMEAMKMYFHFGTDESILFDFWKVNSAFGIICSCLVIILACFCLEFVRWYRVYRKKEMLVNEARGSDEISIEQSRRKKIAKIYDAGMHAIQLTLSYMLMLVFMTFNVWLCLAVVMGEVVARIILSLFFPQLDLFINFIGATSAESCCG